LLDKRNSDTYYLRGLCGLGLQQLSQAATDFKHSLRYKPNDAQAIFWCGVIRQVLNQHAASAAQLNAAHQISEKKGDKCELQRVEARLELLAGKATAARRFYQRAPTSSCNIVSLRMELSYLHQLRMLYPSKSELPGVLTWFEKEFKSQIS
jgi:tetratricopeptide (TPR) repeat protein